jgi:uncharacterized OsmC-like protein
MYGTLAGALSARHVAFDRTRYEATVEGTIDGTIKPIRITKIAVHYRLFIPAGKREATDRALSVHAEGCPAHESVKAAIDIGWDADITEIEPD